MVRRLASRGIVAYEAPSCIIAVSNTVGALVLSRYTDHYLVFSIEKICGISTWAWARARFVHSKYIEAYPVKWLVGDSPSWSLKIVMVHSHTPPFIPRPESFPPPVVALMIAKKHNQYSLYSILTIEYYGTGCQFLNPTFEPPLWPTS